MGHIITFMDAFSEKVLRESISAVSAHHIAASFCELFASVFLIFLSGRALVALAPGLSSKCRPAPEAVKRLGRAHRGHCRRR